MFSAFNQKEQVNALWVTGMIRFIADPGGRSSTAPYHPLHAVWQQQDDAVVANPLGLSRADELVYDALGRVVEVSKLSLPQNQGVRAGHGEAQLEPCNRQPG